MRRIQLHKQRAAAARIESIAFVCCWPWPAACLSISIDIDIQSITDSAMHSLLRQHTTKSRQINCFMSILVISFIFPITKFCGNLCLMSHSLLVYKYLLAPRSLGKIGFREIGKCHTRSKTEVNISQLRETNFENLYSPQMVELRNNK